MSPNPCVGCYALPIVEHVSGDHWKVMRPDWDGCSKWCIIQAHTVSMAITCWNMCNPVLRIFENNEP